MVFFETLKIATVCMGACCCLMSFMIFVHFIKADRAIGKAVALMALGESVGMAVTVVFSFAAEGVIDIIGPISAMALRWVMFAVAAATTLHLAYQTWKVETKQIDK